MTGLKRAGGVSALALVAVLGLPGAASACDALRGRALIREVHVYGSALELGRRAADRAQHAGLGRRLIARAAEIAAAEGFEALAVISAVGTRGYYRGLGFRDGALYQHRATRPDERVAAGQAAALG